MGFINGLTGGGRLLKSILYLSKVYVWIKSKSSAIRKFVNTFGIHEELGHNGGLLHILV